MYIFWRRAYTWHSGHAPLHRHSVPCGCQMRFSPRRTILGKLGESMTTAEIRQGFMALMWLTSRRFDANIEATVTRDQGGQKNVHLYATKSPT